MSISLYTFIKNEELHLEQMIKSVYNYVSEIVVVDTGSQDRSLEIAKDYGARIYQIGFTDFGKIRTLASHLCRGSYCLGLDGDEILENGNLLWNLQDRCEDAYAFPRKRWADFEMKQQLEVEAFPDLQVRFYRNNLHYTWQRELHEYFDGAAVTHIFDGPIIHHFHDPVKALQPNRLQERKELYTKLAKKAHVSIEGGKAL